MLYFALCAVLLVVGYAAYGRVVERVFGVDASRPVPAETCRDGVDFVPMPTWKVFLIQLLNVAGIGPVFGPILAALYGPSALIWIVIGCVFAGGVHDFFSGLASVRSRGRNIPELVGDMLGMPARQLVRVFSLILLVLVGVVFVLSPASLLSDLTGGRVAVPVFIAVIFGYYFVATIIPIDKLIGRIYPLFGLLLILMSVGVAIGMLAGGRVVLPELPSGPGVTAGLVGAIIVVIAAGWFFLTRVADRMGGLLQKCYLLFGVLILIATVALGIALFVRGDTGALSAFGLANTHPQGLPIWPLLFITLACGAISGFHATQSPLMARCLTSERDARRVFYGAMSAVGLIALVWATVALSFYDSPAALKTAIDGGTAAAVVKQAAMGMLGGFGVVAVLGVIVLPITSGDTAFRSARLIIAETFQLGQKRIAPRLWIAVPLFALGFVVSRVDFSVLWRYFGWANQTLAMLVLWAAAVWLQRQGRVHWIASVPAAFMTAVSITFIAYASIGLQLAYPVAVLLGIVATLVACGAFWWWCRNGGGVPEDAA